MTAFPILLKASLRAYYRNRSAMFFSLLVPLMIMVIFGLLNLGSNNISETVGIVDNAQNDSSKQVVDSLQKVSLLKLRPGAEDAEKAALQKGERALVLVLPKGMGEAPKDAQGAPAPVEITIYTNKAKPQDAAIARAIVTQQLDQLSFAVLNAPGGVFQPRYQDLPGQNQTYTDFLVPGIIALSIMQTGIFSVAFAFVEQKQTGVLRRLMATPMKVTEYLGAQVTTRLIMASVQVAILLAVGLIAFHFHLTGNIVELMIAAILGSAIFIALGFAIAGFAKNEQVVPAVANIIVLPMMFLSGIFFSRENMPGWLHTISNFLPLTYVTDAIRSISLDGLHLWNIGGDMLGMLVWLAVMVALAVRFFRWEVT